jgi:hypothetical protein
MWVAENTLYCKVTLYWCDHESCEECERIGRQNGKSQEHLNGMSGIGIGGRKKLIQQARRQLLSGKKKNKPGILPATWYY